jgi:hypothetical protein
MAEKERLPLIREITRPIRQDWKLFKRHASDWIGITEVGPQEILIAPKAGVSGRVVGDTFVPGLSKEGFVHQTKMPPYFIFHHRGPSTVIAPGSFFQEAGVELEPSEETTDPDRINIYPLEGGSVLETEGWWAKTVLHSTQQAQMLNTFGGSLVNKNTWLYLNHERFQGPYFDKLLKPAIIEALQEGNIISFPLRVHSPIEDTTADADAGAQSETPPETPQENAPAPDADAGAQSETPPETLPEAMSSILKPGDEVELSNIIFTSSPDEVNGLKAIGVDLVNGIPMVFFQIPKFEGAENSTPRKGFKTTSYLTIPMACLENSEQIFRIKRLADSITQEPEVEVFRLRESYLIQPRVRSGREAAQSLTEFLLRKEGAIGFVQAEGASRPQLVMASQADFEFFLTRNNNFGKDGRIISTDGLATSLPSGKPETQRVKFVSTSPPGLKAVFDHVHSMAGIGCHVRRQADNNRVWSFEKEEAVQNSVLGKFFRPINEQVEPLSFGYLHQGERFDDRQGLENAQETLSSSGKPESLIPEDWLRPLVEAQWKKRQESNQAKRSRWETGLNLGRHTLRFGIFPRDGVDLETRLLLPGETSSAPSGQLEDNPARGEVALEHYLHQGLLPNFQIGMMLELPQAGIVSTFDANGEVNGQRAIPTVLDAPVLLRGKEDNGYTVRLKRLTLAEFERMPADKPLIHFDKSLDDVGNRFISTRAALEKPADGFVRPILTGGAEGWKSFWRGRKPIVFPVPRLSLMVALPSNTGEGVPTESGASKLWNPDVIGIDVTIGRPENLLSRFSDPHPTRETLFEFQQGMATRALEIGYGNPVNLREWATYEGLDSDPDMKARFIQAKMESIRTFLGRYGFEAVEGTMYASRDQRRMDELQTMEAEHSLAAMASQAQRLINRGVDRVIVEDLTRGLSGKGTTFFVGPPGELMTKIEGRLAELGSQAKPLAESDNHSPEILVARPRLGVRRRALPSSKE